MAIYTISLDFLEKLERSEISYIGDILYTLSNTVNCNKIAVDKNKIILDIYKESESEVKDSIIQWCDYISKLSSPIFERTNADISDMTDRYDKCHEICKAINGRKNLIIHTYSTYPRPLSDDNSFMYDEECEIHVFNKDDAKDDINRNQSVESFGDKAKGLELIDQLKQCPKGREGWKKYEDIGTEIFTFLFKDGFRNYSFEYQSSTSDGIQRRDLVVNNTYKEANGFWQQMNHDFNSKIIIIDFKNYEEELTSDNLYIPTKYLNSTVGNFVIVFSRKGLDKTAKKSQLKLLSEKKQLVICLTDDDLIDMISQKMKGLNPLNTLESIYYSLCKSI